MDFSTQNSDFPFEQTIRLPKTVGVEIILGDRSVFVCGARSIQAVAAQHKNYLIRDRLVNQTQNLFVERLRAEFQLDDLDLRDVFACREIARINRDFVSPTDCLNLLDKFF